MLKEVLEYLEIKKGIFLDLTFGAGGHTRAVLESSKDVKAIALDKDMDAIKRGEDLVSIYKDRLVLKHFSYNRLDEALDELNVEKVDAILMDLGVSTFQLKEAQRGFSFINDGPLDMRMDKTQDLTAMKVVNNYSYEDIKEILRKYGEERYAPLITKHIVRAREVKEIKTTLELAKIIENCYPARKKRESKIHVATRTFQGLRIFVNSELKELTEAIEKSFERLNKGGRLAIISFHSLEDRIVKEKFKYYTIDCICPRDFPICVCDKEKTGKVLTRKPLIPSEKEVEENAPSRSAKLRVIEKL